MVGGAGGDLVGGRRGGGISGEPPPQSHCTSTPNAKTSCKKLEEPTCPPGAVSPTIIATVPHRHEGAVVQAGRGAGQGARLIVCSHPILPVCIWHLCRSRNSLQTAPQVGSGEEGKGFMATPVSPLKGSSDSLGQQGTRRKEHLREGSDGSSVVLSTPTRWVEVLESS